ncbi:hypothetical protein GLX27_000326 [Malassezia furfur]|uniref:Uncharacterized protein n=1 Tax=Malassezia furfur TaxID=55194 RepID=A0ABY8EIX1_MALFU|nr:hypothetical protein CBS14141_001993 [Malassezia furfur]WFD45702.1 hypothetical protein GLX27_000326 [Malassezia furfur]
MGNPYLVDFEELPAWAKDNAFLRHGYRRPGDAPPRVPEKAPPVPEKDTALGASTLRRRTHATASETHSEPTYRHDTYYQCWRSVWDYWHNETVNIHTHLIGAIVAIVVLLLQLADLAGVIHLGNFSLYSFPSRPDYFALQDVRGIAMRTSQQVLPPDTLDQVVLAVFLLSAIVCLGCSATFHTLACHSEKVAKSINRLDYVGIVVLIVGSNIPALRYGLYCHPLVHHVYLVLILFWGALALYVVVQPAYATPRLRPVRSAVFVALGLSGVLPILHGSYLSNWSAFVFETLGYKYIAWSGALYIFGTLLYVAHVPERLAPGRFDYIGASHQLFHACVLFAALLHLVALRRSYLFWHVVETTSGEAGRQAVCRALHFP